MYNENCVGRGPGLFDFSKLSRSYIVDEAKFGVYVKTQIEIYAAEKARRYYGISLQKVATNEEKEFLRYPFESKYQLKVALDMLNHAGCKAEERQLPF